ncbi:MAG: response regulator [Smithellaceae bacterium]|nr:response regulator [Smithellaceae bacterium]
MKKALIVDDNEQNLYLLRTMLEACGYQVLTATNGVEALAEARRDPPDILISDILMPVMDGFTLCREWQKDGLLQRIPFVFYTATYTDSRDEELALSLGAARFIVKPEETQAFAALLDEVMEGRKTGPSLAARPPMPEETDYYRLYSETLVRKLEDKMLQLEELNRALAQENAERKRTEEQLAASAAELRGLFRAMNDVVLVFDRHGRYLKIAPTSPNLLYRPPEELLGKMLHEVFTAQDADFFLAQIQAALEKKQSVNVEYALEIGGEKVWFAGTVSPLDGEGVIWVARDITGSKQAEEERRRLEERLRGTDKMDAIGTLAGGIAHDFNNLLMVIQGYTSMMLKDIDPSNLNYERLRRIEEQVQSGAGLTRQLLGFARGGRYEVTPADINDIIEKTSSLFGRTKKEISIHRKYGKDLWPVEVDRGQMEQVFMNLFVNAWQAMPGGGDLYLETEDLLLDEKQAFPYAVMPGKYVKISVTDNGTGMDEKTRERIFDPFFTTREMGRGTGLGLATVYGIIKGHGGMINVYSEPGCGTSFTIYLPASEKEALKEKTMVGTIARGTETILLVDDEKMVLEVTGTMLETLGYRVFVASSGQGAIDIYLENRNEVALVILDMIMPGISGGETFNRLREINPEIKVLLSSGYALNGQAQEIMNRGCNGFLQKPFQLEIFSRKVREMLD